MEDWNKNQCSPSLTKQFLTISQIPCELVHCSL